MLLELASPAEQHEGLFRCVVIVLGCGLAGAPLLAGFLILLLRFDILAKKVSFIASLGMTANTRIALCVKGATEGGNGVALQDGLRTRATTLRNFVSIVFFTIRLALHVDVGGLGKTNAAVCALEVLGMIVFAQSKRVLVHKGLVA